MRHIHHLSLLCVLLASCNSEGDPAKSDPGGPLKDNYVLGAAGGKMPQPTEFVLFNGEDLSGWLGATDGYFVDNAAIVSDPETGGNLYTESEFADFVLRFEFRLTPGANNGLGIRAPLEGDAAYVGMELQVLDDGALVYANLQPYQYHGSVYGVAASERGHQRPAGQWNEQEVVAHGRRIRVTLNGTVIVDVDLDEVSTPATADGRDHPGLARASGHIGFLGHGHRVEYRSIRIRELR